MRFIAVAEKSAQSVALTEVPLDHFRQSSAQLPCEVLLKRCGDVGRLAGWGALCGLLILCTIATADADITLPRFFSDHMVIQQTTRFPIVGMAEPNQMLLIRFNDSELKTTAGPDGKFSTSIQTPQAGGPYSLEIADENDASKVVLTDVMVGDVWLCAGQANMAMPVVESSNAETEIELAKKCGQMRLLQIDTKAALQPADEIQTNMPWATCAPESVKQFSAVAYFFGRRLTESLGNTPIGLVQATSDGATCEAWCSPESMTSNKELDPMMRYWQENDNPDVINRPGTLYNGVIAPLKRFPFKGVIWYQGEANVGRGKQYATLLPCLMEGWRKSFAMPELPFYMVQITPFRYANLSEVALPELWEAQLSTAKNVANASMIPTMDAADDGEVRPKNKRLIGDRLARLALAETYGLPGADSLAGPLKAPVTGPTFESVAYRGPTIRVTFRNVGTGLQPISDGNIGSFMICGPDSIFRPAIAKIVGPASVEVSSADVSDPQAVRYCWNDQSKSTIVNNAGLPAFPFRSDTLELSSEGAAY